MNRNGINTHLVLHDMVRIYECAAKNVHRKHADWNEVFNFELMGWERNEEQVTRERERDQRSGQTVLSAHSSESQLNQLNLNKRFK